AGALSERARTDEPEAVTAARADDRPKSGGLVRTAALRRVRVPGQELRDVLCHRHPLHRRTRSAAAAAGAFAQASHDARVPGHTTARAAGRTPDTTSCRRSTRTRPAAGVEAGGCGRPVHAIATAPRPSALRLPSPGLSLFGEEPLQDAPQQGLHPGR